MSLEAPPSLVVVMEETGLKFLLDHWHKFSNSSRITNLRNVKVESLPNGAGASSYSNSSNSSKITKLRNGKVESLPNGAGASSQPLLQALSPAVVKCIVKANHFFAEFPDKDIYQYNVTITPEVVTSRGNCAVMEELVGLYKGSLLGQRLPVYDGRKSLYTAGPLPFVTQEFTITLIDEDDDDGSGRPRREEREFKVLIKLAECLDSHHADVHHEALLQLINIVMLQLPSTRYRLVGRSFYSTDIGQIHPLGGALEIWRGFYQSIRPTQMGLSLNIDMTSDVFMKPLNVDKFVRLLLYTGDKPSRRWSNSTILKVEKALRGVEVEVSHHGKIGRKYRISGLTSLPTQELTFAVDERGTMKSVIQYFREKYGVVIKYIQWPCLQVEHQHMPIYLPMEVSKIVEGQMYTERLDEDRIAAFRKVTCQRPEDREHDIIQAVHHNAYAEDPYVKEFGIKISENPISIEARILPAPLLKYHETGRENYCLPHVGQWNMRNKKMVNGGAVKSWVCINFTATVSECLARRFCYYLGKMCTNLGMAFNPDPVLPEINVRPHLVGSGLKALSDKIKLPEELDLLIAILPSFSVDRGSLYGDLKRICETELGIVSQCCLSDHVRRMSYHYLQNMALKINVKVGGRNTVLVDALSGRLPLVSTQPTIIFGADVTHPHPGEDSSSPSIAAVVASQDWPEITKYASLVSAQAHRQELIQDLFKSWQDPIRGSLTGGMIREHLISFSKATGYAPQSIIFYRDGVSESQFHQVLNSELDAIRKACASIDVCYRPPVTFVVVQKQHHTCLFADNHSDLLSVDCSGNILPGTVVDSKICSGAEIDFYLCSHAGIQGTSRPTHYHVLLDENKFTPAELQSLTYNLCYTYARSTRSVSIVPPAYYAHLVALRARFYMSCDTSGTSTMRPVKENLKGTMY